ncbi:MAG: Stp1/IreP family PP2C-type Ser/Thr phosphatase [Deltaproteobacteria bacterium]|nr:Stp1/IreP family PP2C-type Ser/Thr phosphatase [Deltaproteobacteria bacterium]
MILTVGDTDKLFYNGKNMTQTPSFEIESYGMSNVGMKRTQNEDSYLVNDSLNLYFIADGMGGHVGGEYASRLAVTTIEEVMGHFVQDPEATVISGVNSVGSELGDQIRFAIREASRRIYEEATANAALRGMGTTAVGVMVDDSRGYFANVGDSRAYLIRDREIMQITKDHSLVGEQVREGIIGEEEAKVHKLKNIITRSVGFQEEVEADIETVSLKNDDIIMLCSDGLSNQVKDAEIYEILSKLDLPTGCKRLIDLANSRGGDDNITLVVLQVHEITKQN